MIENDVMNIDNPAKDSETIVGIDFGTCNSCVGIWRRNAIEIIPDEKGNMTIPSVVAFTNRTIYVGYEAKNQMEINQSNVFYEVKRLLGKKITDESVIDDKQFLNYELSGDTNNNIRMITNLENNKYHKHEYSPEEIASIIFMKLKHMASDYLHEKITKAVISVPAYFNDAQRQATKDAAKIAGITCMRIINEPVSSALAYGLNKLSKNIGNKNVIVYDLGGGTLDVSLLSINDGTFEVLGSVGNTHLGGADFDNKLFKYCINKFKKNHNFNKMDNISVLSLQNLRKACENAKKVLSTTFKTIIGVTKFYNDIDLIIPMTRPQFEELCSDLFTLCLKPLSDVLRSCSYKKEQIDEIILVGGMTRVPMIRDNIEKFFEKTPNSSINPDEAVAAGAAIQGFILANKSDPFSEYVTLMDVTTLSLGVETIGGLMTVMIPRGSFVPITNKKIFTNDSDNETSILIKVFEGERTMTKDNFLVGDFELCDLQKAPKGYHKIVVTFFVDIDGIITVSAEDAKGNSKKSLRINGNKGRLSAEKIQELIKESVERELQDTMLKEKKILYYDINDMCDNILKNIEDAEINISAKEKKMIIDDVNDTKKWLKEKPFYENEKDDYMHIKDRISKKYCVLVLKASEPNQKISANIQSVEVGTTVFQEDDEHSIIFEKIVKDELGISDETNNTEKNEIIQVRLTLIELCHMVYDILDSDKLNISKEHRNELRDYINDVLLWVHVQQQCKVSEYSEKLNDVTNECNKLTEYYNDKIFVDNTKCVNNEREELEQLCITFKSGIISNLFPSDDEIIKKIENIVDTTLEWLSHIDNDDKNIHVDEYIEKIACINELCTQYHNLILRHTYDDNIQITK